MGMSCPSSVGCFEDGVGCARECDTGLGQCSGPSLGLQVDDIMSSTLPFQYGIHRTGLHTCHRYVFEASFTEPYYVNVCMSGCLRPMLKMM